MPSMVVGRAKLGVIIMHVCKHRRRTGKRGKFPWLSFSEWGSSPPPENLKQFENLIISHVFAKINGYKRDW